MESQLGSCKLTAHDKYKLDSRKNIEDILRKNNNESNVRGFETLMQMSERLFALYDIRPEQIGLCL